MSDTPEQTDALLARVEEILAHAVTVRGETMVFVADLRALVAAVRGLEADRAELEAANDRHHEVLDSVEALLTPDQVPQYEEVLRRVYRDVAARAATEDGR